MHEAVSAVSKEHPAAETFQPPEDRSRKYPVFDSDRIEHQGPEPHHHHRSECLVDRSAGAELPPSGDST